MHLLTLPLSSNSHVYVEGDVSIAPSAAIAAGVILRADPDSRIIIAAGVCLGMGSILHAQRGTLEVEAGANLGAGVLMVGKGKIGVNACIGPITTIWNESIEPGQVVAAGSVIGDNGRVVVGFSPASMNSMGAIPPDPPASPPPTPEALSPAPVSPPTGDVDVSTPPPVESSDSATQATVYGQGNLNRLLKTLFPYNQSLIQPSAEDED